MHEALAPAATQSRRRRDTAHQICRSAHEVLRCAHVAPVTGVDVPAHPDVIGEQGGKHLPLHRHLPATRDPVDDVAVENVTAGVDLVGRGVFGLLQERQHVAVRIGGHTAEGPRITDTDQMQREFGVALVMSVEQRAQIDTGKHVAVEDQHGVAAQQRRDVRDSAARAQRSFFGDVVHPQAQRGAVAELRLEGVRP